MDGFYDLPGREPGSGFSDVVVASGFAYLAGKVATEAHRPVTIGDIDDETRACMEILGRVLDSVGLDLTDVVKVNVYMTNLDDFDRMNAVYQTYFEEGSNPARTTVEVSKIVLGCNVEIDAVARMKVSPT